MKVGIKKNKIPALTQVSNLKYSLFHEVFLVEVFSTTDLREKIKSKRIQVKRDIFN